MKKEKPTVDEAMMIIFLRINRGRKSGDQIPVFREQAERALKN